MNPQSLAAPALLLTLTLAMWDDQRVYAAGLVRFLKEIDAGRNTVAF